MIAVAIGSVVLTAFGMLAYLGVIKKWSPVKRGFDEYLGFTALYCGLSLGCFFVAGFTERSTLLYDTLFWLGVGLIWFSIVTFFYFPKFLLPRWWKDLHDQPREDR